MNRDLINIFTEQAVRGEKTAQWKRERERGGLGRREWVFFFCGQRYKCQKEIVKNFRFTPKKKERTIEKFLCGTSVGQLHKIFITPKQKQKFNRTQTKKFSFSTRDKKKLSICSCPHIKKKIYTHEILILKKKWF